MTVTCDTHGDQQETFVCEHILEGSKTGRRVGFFLGEEGANPRPDAWCAECEQVFQEIGGDWELAPEREPKIHILCGLCYDKAKQFHSGEVA